jgi:phage terminase large subunit
MTYQFTTATKKVASLSKRIRAVAGGTSASKTISILMWLIDYAQTTKNETISIVSESFPHLSLGAILDFQMIMKVHGYWEQARWHDTKHTYTFKTGSYIEFYSVDYSKAHGPRRDVLFINEANNLPYKTVDQLITRTRKIVWMDWNPTEEFYFYTDMLGKRDDIDFLTLTYLDNEALDKVTISEIESHKNDKNWWQVYGLGQLGEIETRIYKGWQIVPAVPHEARLEFYGLDYGYSHDPTAIVAVYWYNGGYIFDEIAYQKGLSNKQIYDIISAQPTAPVVPDSAEPKSNDELVLYGLTVVPAVKGPDSVRQGIRNLQAQKCSITERSVHIIREYRNYTWMTDKDGNIIQEPNHAFSHSMDAIRYPMQTLKVQTEPDEHEKAERLMSRLRNTPTQTK